MLLGIKWANDIFLVINFKKRVMNFENRDITVIAPMDSTKGRRYVEPIKEESIRGWYHAYNISQDYIHLNVDGDLRWRSSISESSGSNDALEKWKNRMHEVLLRKYVLITQSLHQVATDTTEFPVYEELPELSEFLVEFEDQKHNDCWC